MPVLQLAAFGFKSKISPELLLDHPQKITMIDIIRSHRCFHPQEFLDAEGEEHDICASYRRRVGDSRVFKAHEHLP
jgi:hypothetical protein